MDGREGFLRCQRCHTFILSGTSTAKRIHNVKCLSSSLSNGTSSSKKASGLVQFQGFDNVPFPMPFVSVIRLTNEDIMKIVSQEIFNTKRVSRGRKSKEVANKKLQDQFTSEAEDNPGGGRRRKGSGKDPTFQSHLGRKKDTINSKKKKPDKNSQTKKYKYLETCKICEKSMQKYALQKHMHIKHPEQHKPEDCNENCFKNNHEDKKRKYTYDHLKPHPCKICGKPVNKYFLQKHMHKHHTDEHECNDNCFKYNYKYRQLKNGNSGMTPSETYKKYKKWEECTVCKKSVNKYTMPKHMHFKHPDQHKPEDCSDKCFKYGDAQRQRDSRTCKVCGKSVNKYHFQKHMHFQHPDQHKPEDCNRDCFKYTYNYDSKKYKYYDPTKTVECPDCNRQVHIYTFRKHQETHQKRPEKKWHRKFTCVVCNLGFALRTALKCHFVLAHLQECPFACRFEGCKRKFGSFHNLESHVVLHMEENLMTCKNCGSQVAGHYQLAEHKCSGRKRHHQAHIKRVSVKQLQTGEGVRNVSPSPIIKMEVEQPIHLIDQVIETEDGPVHLKGEQLEPIPEPVEDEVPASEDTPTPTDAEIRATAMKLILSWNDKLMSSTYVNSVIREDPMYTKMTKEYPDFAQAIFGSVKKVDYQLTSRSLLPNFTCDICSRSFWRVSALKKHQNITGHTGHSQSGNIVKQEGAVETSIKLTCLTCGFKSESPETLRNHVETSHPPSNKNNANGNKYKCTLGKCGWFISLAKLNSHVERVHKATKKFQCNKCDKFYATVQLMKAHQTNIHVYRPYSCKTCKRKFVLFENCEKHEKDCTKEKVRPKCQQCGESFAALSSLQRHIRLIHTRQADGVYTGNNEIPLLRNGVTKNDSSNENDNEMILGF